MSGWALMSSTVGSLPLAARNAFSQSLISARTASMFKDNATIATNNASKFSQFNSNMNRPRHSVLALFDPLSSPATPARDPDDDKENSTPLDAFLPRPNSHHPSTPVALPRKRLIDVGDATLADASILDLLTEEREPDSTSVPCLETPVPPFQPRTPLAELALRNADPTPVVRFKARPSSPLLPSALLNGHGSITDNICDMDADNSAIPAFNANAINTPEILISSCHSMDSQPSLHAIDLNSTPSPLHQVDSSFQGDIGSVSRLYAPNITSHRLSIDLQDAFQIHFQHNSNFDLLNDKISLTEPMESLMADENFDFELERENLRDAMARFKKEFTPCGHRICVSHHLLSVFISLLYSNVRLRIAVTGIQRCNTVIKASIRGPNVRCRLPG